MRLILTAIALAVVGLQGCSFDYFDDPAVKACRVDLKSQLRSPSTYREIETNLVSVAGINSVSVSYDAANAYGTPVRGAHNCNYLLYDGNFYFMFPPEDTDETFLSNTSRWLRLSSADLYKIPEGRTKLRRMFPDAAVDLCLQAALTEDGGRISYLPRTGTFRVRKQGPENYQFVVVIESLERRDAVLPASIRCVASAAGDGYELISVDG